MDQSTLVSIVREQTNRALWEVRNVINCIPDAIWEKPYCVAPCWQHVYHMLHSLDMWYINPRAQDYQEPSIHTANLNNLDISPEKTLTRTELDHYFADISQKLSAYLDNLTDEALLTFPPDCEYTRFTLILAQFRHLHSHMGMLMGFIIAETGLWPRVLGLEGPFPAGKYDKYL